MSQETKLAIQNRIFVERLYRFHPERAPKPMATSTPVSMDELLDAAADVTGYDVDALRKPRQSTDVARVRQIVCWMARERIGMPVTKIGRILGRNHATVIQGCRTIERMLEEVEPRVTQVIRAIDTRIGERRP